MTITIDLPDTTLAALRADAGTQGRPIEAVAAEHLAALYDPQDSLDDALEEAFCQSESGQGQPFDTFAADLRTRFDARHAAAKPAPGQAA